MKFPSLTIMAMLVFSPLSPFARANHLSVGWDLWYPYQYHNEHRELVGLDIEALDAIMKLAELEYATAEIPWKAHLDFIKSGKVDIALGASWSKERAEYAHFSLPYRQETIKLFVKAGRAKNISLDSLADLVGSSYLIGVSGGYYYGDEYQKLIENAGFKDAIREGIDLQHNVSLLMDDKLDGILVDPINMNAFIEKYEMHEAFEQHPVEVFSTHVHLMLSKKSLNESILNKVNQAIETLKKEGVLQKINHIKH